MLRRLPSGVSAFADRAPSPPDARTAPQSRHHAARADSPVDLQMRGLAHHAKFNMILYNGGFAERAAARPLEALALGVELTR